jgi:hypothetical protein
MQRFFTFFGQRSSPLFYLLFILTCIASLVVFAIPDGLSGFIQMTRAWEKDTLQLTGLLGFTGFESGEPIGRENLYFLIHANAFLNGAVAGDFYFLRPVQSFLASVFVPITGWRNSFLVLNIINWVSAAGLMYVFARGLHLPKHGALLAALLAFFGIGFAAHAHSASAHLMAFTVYLGCLTLVHRTGL